MVMRTTRIPLNGHGSNVAPTIFPEDAARSPAQIRVLLVDDHTLFRQGIRALLEAQRDIVVVGEAWNHLKELRLDRGPMSREDAVAELTAWWNARGGSTV